MLWRDEIAEKLWIFSQNVECILVSVIMKRKIRKRKVTWEPTWEQMPKLNSCIIRLGSPPTRQKFAHPISHLENVPPVDSPLPPPQPSFYPPTKSQFTPPLNNNFQNFDPIKTAFLAVVIAPVLFLFGHLFGHVTFNFNWCSVFTESCF